MGNLRRVAFLVLGAALAAPACIATSNEKLHRQTDDDAGGPGPVNLEGGSTDAAGEIPPTDPHAVLGVDPPHGPFNGGQLVMVRGNGFTSKVRVWFGASEIAAADVLPVDPQRVQVVVPPGKAGPADVTTQNGDDASTRRTLTGGYSYDAFYVDPASGPVSGGTTVTLHGQDTSWDDKTTVLFDLLPCPVSQVNDPTAIVCTTPKGTPGTKPVRVTTADGTSTDVLDAFTYGDSDNGFKGGLSGNALKDQLRVLVLDNYTGNAVPGASVVLDDDLATLRKSDSGGVALFQDATLGPKRSVTVAKKCYQPQTFVDVPVDTVTVYLDPVLSPACASQGDPPPVGGSPGYASTVSGELLWTSVNELKHEGWTNVPAPKSADEQRVAYVFSASSDPTRAFNLPSATAAVTPDSVGTSGFGYTVNASPGNLVLYALAGIENRAVSPPLFTAYAMGVTKGISAKPGKATGSVFIPVDVPLDHALVMTATGPTPTSHGPDRIQASTAIRIANALYAVLPVSQKSRLMPVTSPLSFVGVPALTGSVSGGAYVVTASAVTGIGASDPRSVVGQYVTTTTNDVVALDGFVQIPVLSNPGANGAWNGQDLAVGFAPGGASIDLVVVDIDSGSGLVAWTVAAPAGVTSVRLPDLAQLGADLGLVPGPIKLKVSAAHIDGFVYGSLQYRQLGTRGWNAYAEDVFYAHY